MAFFQDTRPAREPFLNAPASVLWLIGLLLAAHAARVLVPAEIGNEILTNYAFVPARYSPEVLAAHGLAQLDLFEQAITFVSYIFLHANFAHVIVNSLWLLAFGPAVARRLGSPLFLIFFLICGVAAAAVHLAANWGALIPVIGASGAVSGLMGAGIRILYRNRSLVFGERPKIASIFAGPVLFFSGMWVFVNIAAGLTGLGLTDNMALVAWEAHLGGYFTGLLLIGWFDALRRDRNQPAQLEQ
jgi:membrane associated rhomboid family serine protease